MSHNVVVSGVPGVGASKVCEHARRRLGDEYTLVNVGDIMLEEALEHGLARSREELSRLRLRDQRALQRRAGAHIARRSDAGPLLINTHLVVETPLGYVPGMDEAVLQEISPAAFVVVDASDEEIRARREASNRSYDQFSPVSFHRQLQTAAAFAFSAQTNAPIHHVSNEGEVADAADRLASIVGVIANLEEHP